MSPATSPRLRPEFMAEMRTSRCRSLRRIVDGPVAGSARRHLAERDEDLVAAVVVLVGRHPQRQEVVRVAALVGAQAHAHVVAVAGRVLDRGRDLAR